MSFEQPRGSEPESLARARRVVAASFLFDPKDSLFVHGLSLFHGWLPGLLLWLVWGPGYDRRAFPVPVVLTWAILPASSFLAPAPPAPSREPERRGQHQLRNSVHGMSYERPQTWMRTPGSGSRP
ncbi:hypothetical protein AB1L88_26360 [Tautonia sp. JC769]|uniref:hypothetical protein n=1 Tax=Tautonia sp. JC769 TaxID=3232135 RepID=UPI003457D63F